MRYLWNLSTSKKLTSYTVLYIVTKMIVKSICLSIDYIYLTWDYVLKLFQELLWAVSAVFINTVIKAGVEVGQEQEQELQGQKQEQELLMFER